MRNQRQEHRKSEMLRARCSISVTRCDVSDTFVITFDHVTIDEETKDYYQTFYYTNIVLYSCTYFTAMCYYLGILLAPP